MLTCGNCNKKCEHYKRWILLDTSEFGRLDSPKMGAISEDRMNGAIERVRALPIKDQREFLDIKPLFAGNRLPEDLFLAYYAYYAAANYILNDVKVKTFNFDKLKENDPNLKFADIPLIKI